MGIVARTVATEVRPATQLVAENRSAQVNLGTGRADIISPGNLRARYLNQRRQAIILRLSGVVRLEGRCRTKRPRLAGCKGRGRWRRVCSNAHFRQIIPAAIVTGVDRIRCSVTQIFRYRLSKRYRANPSSRSCEAVTGGMRAARGAEAASSGQGEVSGGRLRRRLFYCDSLSLDQYRCRGRAR
jgi:hypothetical protein